MGGIALTATRRATDNPTVHRVDHTGIGDPRTLADAPLEPFGIPHGVRINSGTKDETDFAINVIEKVHARVLNPTELATN